MVTEFENLEREGLVELLKKFKSKNGQLSDQISQMKVIVAKLDQNDENLDNIISEPKKKKLRKERTKEFLKRKIAVRFSYDGSEFNGLQRSPVPTSKITVEDCLFHALIKSHIVDNVAISDYIAGGRTDKGVHAVNNVFSIIVNSQLSEDKICAGETIGERDFVSILNRQLPDSIIVTSWAPVDLEFSARFSCQSRHYEYLFSGEGLNIDAMNQAAKLLEGENDFRNFSQAQLERQDTKRICFKAEILSLDDLPGMYVFSIKSSGFLYHQIRLTMAILALIGNDVEEISLISELLNVDKYPRRPSYKYSNPDGLVLVDCNYEGLNWIKTKNNRFSAQKVNSKLYNMKIAVAIQQRIKDELILPENDKEMAHKKITGISEKLGSHKKILDYDFTPNAADLLLKKEKKAES